MNQLRYWLGMVLLLAVWWLAADVVQITSPLLLPPLGDVLATFLTRSLNGQLPNDLTSTLGRWTAGFSLGALAGIVLGLVIGQLPRLYQLLEIPLEFFRALPVTAIFPLFLILFGIGDASKIAMAFMPTFLLMTINTAYGVLYAAPERQRMARVFGASKWQVFRHVVFWEALPQIFIGLRLAVSLSLIVVVVAEMFIGTDLGMGQRLYDAYLINSITVLYAYLLVLGSFGFLINKLLRLIEKRTVHWL